MVICFWGCSSVGREDKKCPVDIFYRKRRSFVIEQGKRKLSAAKLQNE